MHRRWPVALLALGATALAACSTLPPPGEPLAPRQRAALERRARQPEALGIGTRVEDGRLKLSNIREVNEGALPMALPLNTDLLQPARFPVVRMRINRHLVFGLVDTGSSMSLIEYEATIRARVTPLGPPLVASRGQGLGGRQRCYVGFAESVKLEELQLARVPFGIVDDAWGLSPLWWLEGHRVEAVLGHDFLEPMGRLTINLQGETVTLGGDGPYTPHPDRLAAALPFTMENGLPVIEARVDGIGSLRLVIDSGGDFGLWLPRGMAGRLKLPVLTDNTRVQIGSGVGGESVWKDAGPHTVRLAGLELPGVETRVSMISFDEQDPPFALMGLQALQNFLITFDYRSHTVYLEYL